MTEIRRNSPPGRLWGLPKIEGAPNPQLGEVLPCTDGEPAQKKEEDKVLLAPREAVAPVQQANKVLDALEDLTKTTSASGKALSNVSQAFSAPIDGRHLGLRDAIINGNESGVVKEIAEGTPLAHGIGVINNVFKGGALKQWQDAAKTNRDPDANLTDRTMANLSAAATTADTYKSVNEVATTATEYVQRNWIQANRQLSEFGDVASFSNQALKDSANGVKQIAAEFPGKIVEGLKGNRGGVADVAVKIGEKAGKKVAQETAEQGAKLAFQTSRFAMGLNIACATYDVLHATKVLNSDKSGLQKGLALTTAIGSVIAATNIPGISQAGAAISFATSVAEATVEQKEARAEPVKSSVSWSTAE